MKTEFYFTGISRIKMTNEKGSPTSTNEGVDLSLEVSKNLDKDMYLENGRPNKSGAKALTIALVQGLVANIHACHQKGYWDSAEHLRFIIHHLENGFTAQAQISDGIMEDK